MIDGPCSSQKWAKANYGRLAIRYDGTQTITLMAEVGNQRDYICVRVAVEETLPERYADD
jgi:hypothetical protein